MTTRIPGFPGGDQLRLVDDVDPDDPFAVRDETPSDLPGGYRGPERRKRHRREQADRRLQVRYEPDKAPRRSGRDRRQASWNAISTV